MYGPAIGILALEAAARAAGRWVTAAYADAADEASVVEAARHLSRAGGRWDRRRRAARAHPDGARRRALGRCRSSPCTDRTRPPCSRMPPASRSITSSTPVTAGSHTWPAPTTGSRPSRGPTGSRQHWPREAWTPMDSGAATGQPPPDSPRPPRSPERCARPTARRPCSSANDQMALGLLAGLDDAGVAVPAELSIVGTRRQPGCRVLPPRAHHRAARHRGGSARCIAAVLGVTASEAPRAPVLIARASSAAARPLIHVARGCRRMHGFSPSARLLGDAYSLRSAGCRSTRPCSWVATTANVTGNIVRAAMSAARPRRTAGTRPHGADPRDDVQP